MCLSIPAEILEINGKEGMARVGNVTSKVALDLIEKVKLGDYVLIHSGFAIEVIDEAEAKLTFDLIRDMLD